MEKSFISQVEEGERFGFGENWSHFLKTIDESRINIAVDSLAAMLMTKDLKGKSFIDVGSGSGLSSLAAYRMGANVFSFDFDKNSVACTQTLRAKYKTDQQTNSWEVKEGSVLDADFVNSLGKFDIVNSWGVLHHTGDMYKAFENVCTLCNSGSLLFIAIYDDWGTASKVWRFIKKLYNKNVVGRTVVKLCCVPYYILRGLASDIKHMKNPVKRYTEFKSSRGMSFYYDLIDWIGGYPYEVATPAQLEAYFTEKGFKVINTKYKAAPCNEVVFQKL
jgi:2-polyprenyl-3-methyl-5-hydroxy-6-metoxy-1,4-benzoquinol methylase